jgi:hypothetical protein
MFQHKNPHELKGEEEKLTGMAFETVQRSLCRKV